MRLLHRPLSFLALCSEKTASRVKAETRFMSMTSGLASDETSSPTAWKSTREPESTNSEFLSGSLRARYQCMLTRSPSPRTKQLLNCTSRLPERGWSSIFMSRPGGTKETRSEEHTSELQ